MTGRGEKGSTPDDAPFLYTDGSGSFTIDGVEVTGRLTVDPATLDDERIHGFSARTTSGERVDPATLRPL